VGADSRGQSDEPAAEPWIGEHPIVRPPHRVGVSREGRRGLGGEAGVAHARSVGAVHRRVKFNG
jgi:hypothetical protein